MQCPRALAAHRILVERSYCRVAEVRAAASRRKRPRNAVLVFTGLGNEVSVFDNVALIYRPIIRVTSAEGRLCQSIELDLNGAGKSRSSPESADHPGDAKAFA